MKLPVRLYGVLATHHRGRVLQEAAGATAAQTLPGESSVMLMFADEFQKAEPDVQSQLVGWTRTRGRVLALLPPFAPTPCSSPVAWRADRADKPPSGGEGLSRLLAGEVTYRLSGQLQVPALPGATWSDLSVCHGTYRSHPAAGLFLVTCLPLWSLRVLDAADRLVDWLDAVGTLAGEAAATVVHPSAELEPDHYGLLVFLLSREFADEEQALAALRDSPIVSFPQDRARSLLRGLQERKLVVAAAPTAEGRTVVLQSPYSVYLTPLREMAP